MRKTKIICTLGPKSNSDEVLRELINKGANVFRLNFSHGEYSEHAEHIQRIQRIREELNVPIAILLDTKGPEVRTGNFTDGSVVLTTGQKFTLRKDDSLGDQTGVSITYKKLHEDVKAGDTILIDDGLIGLSVEEIINGDIVCRIVNGGEVSNKKGINVPNIKLSLPAVSQRDKEDIAFGVRMGIEYVAASFIRTVSDVLEVRRAVEEAGGENIGIIAKIENREGVDNIDQIIQVSDGIMVARGDLGVEIPIEEVPLVQKSVIKKCNVAGVISITATQMLDSMIRNPRPTRAESNDVANAVLDGTDAVMLSGETAAGKYPVEAVETMARITAMVEKSTEYENACKYKNKINSSGNSIADSVGRATYSMAESLNAKAIITATKTGHTAYMVAMHRPKMDIIAITMDKKVYNKLALFWGVKPLMSREFTTTDEMLEESESLAKKACMLLNGDTIIITAGIPVGACGVTNLINVRIVGRKMVKGKGIGSREVTGSICIIKDKPDIIHAEKGCILVTQKLTLDMIPAVLKAGAVITEEEGKNIDPAISALFSNISVITDACGAVAKLPNGLYVAVDPVSATVYNKSDIK